MRSAIFLSLMILTRVYSAEVVIDLSKNQAMSSSEVFEMPKVVDKNSEENRLGKTFGFAIKAGVTHNYINSSVSFDYYKEANQIISLEYLESSEETVEVEGALKVLSIGLKKFVGNSFFISPSLSYRNYKKNVTYNISTDGSEIINDFEIGYYNEVRYSDLALGMAIGNQWQWDNLTFGFTWIGVNKQILEISKNHEFGSRYFSSPSYSVTLLNYELGMSF